MHRLDHRTGEVLRLLRKTPFPLEVLEQHNKS
jgi:hypothetical protein